jgi:hypothetical protein
VYDAELAQAAEAAEQAQQLAARLLQQGRRDEAISVLQEAFQHRLAAADTAAAAVTSWPTWLEAALQHAKVCTTMACSGGRTCCQGEQQMRTLLPGPVCFTVPALLW